MLGRATYEMFAPAWSTRTVEDDPGAPFFNDTTKYVVSATLTTAAWRNSTIIGPYDADTIRSLKAEVDGGRNPKDAKVALAKEITARFHSAQAADAAEQDFINRSKGGVPDEIPEVQLSGAPMGIGALLKAAGLAASSGEGNRLIDGGGVRVDSSVVSDKGLKLAAGTYVVQVGKRKFARVTLG